MQNFTVQDCEPISDNLPLTNKVVVLLAACPGQLFFCVGEDESGADPPARSVLSVSLSTGELHTFRRSDIIGALKPELLPEKAKLQLSQIRPIRAQPLQSDAPQYSGYSFLPDGRYAAGVWLCSPQEVRDYVAMQRPYQHRILICDRDDFAVMEVVDGQMVFPTPEQMEAFHQEQKGGGMEMQ